MGDVKTYKHLVLLAHSAEERDAVNALFLDGRLEKVDVERDHAAVYAATKKVADESKCETFEMDVPEGSFGPTIVCDFSSTMPKDRQDAIGKDERSTLEPPKKKAKD